MASLTPASRADEVTNQAMQEGLIYGTMVFLPALGGLYAALKNPKFVKVCSIRFAEYVVRLFQESIPKRIKARLTICKSFSVDM
jgi:hypothetical protein